MKKLLIGVATVGLAVSVGTNVYLVNKEIASQKSIAIDMKTFELKAMNEQVAESQRLNATLVSVQKASIAKAAGEPQADLMGEAFKITEIKNGFARGEKTEGTGEGIYYPLNLFARFGLDNLKIGDKVQIMWTKADYTNENWDNVAEMFSI